MTTLLLLVIYSAFISLGLPDSVLGTAWPVMHGELHASVSSLAIVNVCVSLCTVFSSIFAQKAMRKFGTYAVTAFSIVLTFTALFFISRVNSIYLLILFALPLGLGGGAIDTALNDYVARNYSPAQMNFLHAFWGLGTIIAPILLSRLLASGGSWRSAYVILSAIQTVIFIIVLLSKKLWKKDGSPYDEKKEKVYSIAELLRVPGALPSCLAFTFYAFEGVTISWIASYLVFGKEISASDAASMTSMVYLGITAGRIITGFIANRVKESIMIRTSQAFILLALLVLMMTESHVLLYTIIFIMGFSFGPIYPAMVHQSVTCFDTKYSAGIIGLQMSFAYIGGMIITPFFGILSDIFSLSFFPYYMLLLLALNFICTTLKNRRTRKTSF